MRRGLFPAWLAWLALAGPTATAEPPAAKPATAPNLVLITVDTLRRDHCSFHGQKHDATPRLARLAGEGAVFETAYAPTSTTAPSHATLFTGLYPPSHGVLKNAVPLDESHLTLSERLATHGYQTAAVVSSFVLDRKFRLGQGFAHYEDDFPEATSSATPGSWEGHDVRRGFDRRGQASARRAVRWLWERDRSRPFFLFVHFFDPHSPYDPPEPFAHRFPTPAPEGGGPRDRHDVREHRRLYLGEVAYTDRAIGELLDALEREGLAADTLVVLTADHGEGLFDHGFMDHGPTLYEEVVRVPLVLRWPGVIAPRRIEAPVGLVDIAPTVLELLGLPFEGGVFEGLSLAAALRGAAALDPLRPTFLVRRPYDDALIGGLRVDGELAAIRVGPWKYIEGEAESRAELYHLGRDPGERHDLRAVHPERAARLAEQLQRWRQQQAAPGPLPAISDEDRRALEALGYVE